MDYKCFTPFSDANIDGHMIFGMTGRQCETTMCNGKLLMKDRRCFQTGLARHLNIHKDQSRTHLERHLHRIVAVGRSLDQRFITHDAA